MEFRPCEECGQVCLPEALYRCNRCDRLLCTMCLAWGDACKACVYSLDATFDVGGDADVAQDLSRR